MGIHHNLSIINNIFVNTDHVRSSSVGVLLLKGRPPTAPTANGKYLVKNNTFIGPGEVAVYLSSNSAQIDVSEIYNNVVVNFESPVDFSTLPSFSLDRYDIRSNALFGYSDLESSLVPINLIADPEIDAVSFTPESGSPAIDAGIAEPGISLDFYGNPRPVDGDGDTTAVIDIGAVERQ